MPWRDREGAGAGIGPIFTRNSRVLFMFVQLICIPLMSRPVRSFTTEEIMWKEPKKFVEREKKVQKIFYACIINTRAPETLLKLKIMEAKAMSSC